MDILNWLRIKKQQLIRTTLDSPKDLVVLGADVSFQKRGDKYQSYAMPAEDFGISVKGYKSTVFHIVQKTTNPPSVGPVLINEIGGTWSGIYNAVGDYSLVNSDTTLNFINGTTAIFYTDGSLATSGEVAFENAISEIAIATWNSAGVASNDILNGYLEIRQYI